MLEPSGALQTQFSTPSALVDESTLALTLDAVDLLSLPPHAASTATAKTLSTNDAERFVFDWLFIRDLKPTLQNYGR